MQEVRKRLLLDLRRPYANIIADQIENDYLEAVPADEDHWTVSDSDFVGDFFVLRRFELSLQTTQIMCL